MTKKLNKADQTPESGEQQNKNTNTQKHNTDVLTKHNMFNLIEIEGIKSYEQLLKHVYEKIEDEDVEGAEVMVRNFLSLVDGVYINEVKKRVEKLMKKENITAVNTKFLKLSQDLRILATKYRHENNNGEKYSSEKNYGCNSYGGFKNPSSCGSCNSADENFKTVGLRDLATYTGDRCYAIPQSIIEKAENVLLSDKEQEDIKNINQDMSESVQKIEIIKQQDETKKGLIGFFAKHEGAGKYSEAKKKFPEFVQFVQQEKLYNKYFDKIDIHLDDKLVLYVTRGSQINGTGPMTYWITTTIRYDGQEKSFKHIVRNPSNPDYYDCSFYSPTLEITQKKDLGENREFSIRVYNQDRSNHLDYKALFRKETPDTGSKLDEQAQQKFKEFFEKTMKDTCKSETRENGIMFSWVNGNKVERSRDKAEVTDKSLDLKNGRAAFIIKTQIDSGAHASDRNKQYGRRGYVVSHDEKVDTIWYECGREEELGLMDFTIADRNKINQKKVTAIFDITAKSLLEKNK